MIQEVVMFKVVCDNCKKEFDDGDMGAVAWADAESALYVATESGWHSMDGKHYCDECFFYDDNDKPAIDAMRTKSTSE